ncbi:GDSL-type esterase/lipase family protein [Methylovirgula sp. HY1]|uniref:SGNH/GDSL hydrolase family protein n=1 Tax=Methylovirgula sp. HY1 TaxID=2822761 RepID=UPI001C5B549B|nr:GDSL-type esterase/lipase family protein [Methylovirgula sp. HY1]
MAIGTARRRSQGWRGTSSVAVLVTLAAMVTVAAQATTVVPDTAPSAPLTPACTVPENDISIPGPLPNVMAQLKKGAPVRILAIGSSSTEGIGASSQGKAYPTRLGPMLEKTLKGVDVEVINRGIAGEVADTTADRIMNEVALAKPDLVLWQLGTNDALSRVPPDEFETTVRDTVNWLKSQNIDVALVGMQYIPRFSRDPTYSAIRRSLRKIAAEEHVLYVRRYDAMRFMQRVRANEHLLARDNFHLNDLGYRCMAEHIAHAVIYSLFHKPAPKSHPATPRN